MVYCRRESYSSRSLSLNVNLGEIMKFYKNGTCLCLTFCNFCLLNGLHRKENFKVEVYKFASQCSVGGGGLFDVTTTTTTTTTTFIACLGNSGVWFPSNYCQNRELKR
jgi:hypothetical protein